MKGAVLALCLAILVVSCVGDSVKQNERQQSATAVQRQDARAAANKTADANSSSAEKPPEIVENTQITPPDPAELLPAGDSVQTPAVADAQGAQLDAAAGASPDAANNHRSSRTDTNGRDRRTPNTGRARAGNAAKTAPQKRGTITASGDVTPASISPSSNTAAEDPTAEQQAPASDTEQVQAGATPQADHKQKHRTHTVEDARDKARTENMTVATKRATEQQKANAEAEEQFGQGTVVSVEQEVQQQQRQQWHKEQKQELEQKPQKQAQEQKQQKHEQEQKQQKQAQEQKQQKQKVVPATVQVQVPNQATEVQNLPLAVKSTADDATVSSSVEELVQQFEEVKQEKKEAQGTLQLQGQSNTQIVNQLAPETQSKPQGQAQTDSQAQAQAQAQVQIKTDIQSQNQFAAPTQAEVQTTPGAVKALPTSTASRLRVAGIDTSITPLGVFGAAAASEATKPVLLTLTAKPAIAAAAAAAAPAMPADGLIRAGTQVAAFLIKALQAASNSTAAAAAAERDSPDEQDAMGGLIDAAFGSRMRGNAGQFGAYGQMVKRPGGPVAAAARNGPRTNSAFARPSPNARGPSGNANSRNANGKGQAARHIAGQGPSAGQGSNRPRLTAKYNAGSRKVQMGAAGARPQTSWATKQSRPTSTHPGSKASRNKPAALSAPKQQHSKAPSSRT